MIEESLNIGLVILYVYSGFWASLGYMILGLILWTNSTFISKSPSALYKFGLLSSLAVLVLKGIVIFHNFLGFNSEFYVTYSCILKSIAFSMDLGSIKIIGTLVPDTIAFFICLFGLLLSWEDLKLVKKFRNYAEPTVVGFLKLFGLVLLCIISNRNYSIPSIFYAFNTVFWATSSGLSFKLNLLKSISRCNGIISIVQILLPLVSYKIPKIYGQIEKYDGNYGLIIGINIAFSALSKHNLVTFSKEQSEPLVPTEKFNNVQSEFLSPKENLEMANNQKPEPAKTKEYSFKVKMAVFIGYFILKVCIFLWIYEIPGMTGLFMIVWTGFNLLQPKIYTSMRTIKLLLVPFLSISFGFSYINSMLKEHYSYLNILMLFTIILACYIYNQSKSIKDIEYSLPSTWYGKICSIIIENSYSFSLSVLFVIGLFKINLFHTGLMIFCLGFMCNIKLVKDYWKFFIVYLMLIIFMQYLVNLIIINDQCDASNSSTYIWILLKIGFISNSCKLYGVYYHSYLWLLLLCSSIQQFAINNNKIVDSLDDYKNKTFSVIETAYNYFNNIESWLIFIVLFITIFVSYPNLLNFFRLLILIWIISSHLSKPLRKINYKTSKIDTSLGLLKYYSSFVWALRYVYQFDIVRFDNNFVGLEIYDTKNLYEKTVSDSILVIASVLLQRSINYKITKSNPTNKVENIDAKKESNMIKKIFFKTFSIPFQYFVIVTVTVLCIYWKLSLSMLIYLIIIGVYQLHITVCFTRHSIRRSKNLLKKKDFKFKENYDLNQLKSINGHKNNRLKITGWQARQKFWTAMFIVTTMSLIYSYIIFITDILKKGTKYYNYFEFGMFIAGYSANNQSYVLKESYGYLIIFASLIIERFCIQYIIPRSLKEACNGWPKDSRQNFESIGLNYNGLETYEQQMSLKDLRQRSRSSVDGPLQKDFRQSSRSSVDNPLQVGKYSYESLKKKINFISALNLLKVIAEAIIPMLILILAFRKLNTISFIYVFSVLIAVFFFKKYRIILLSFTLVLWIWIQYGVLLTNINSDLLPLGGSVPDQDLIPIPWCSNTSNYFCDTFVSSILNDGLNFMFFDILTQIFAFIYYVHLFKREAQLEFLNEELEKLIEPENEGLRSIPHDFKSKLKFFLYDLKNLFYKFARFSIVIIVLLFTTQSEGLISCFYCIFCLIFIFKENSILLTPDKEKNQKKSKNIESSTPYAQENQTELKEPLLGTDSNENQREVPENNSNQRINSYTRLLSGFLILILLDLTMQTIVQFTRNNKDSSNATVTLWFECLGILDLTADNDGKNSDIINFKIYTFTILLMVQAMMYSQDFLDNHKNQCEKIKKESEEISKKMSEEFNNNRIRETKKFEKSKKKFAMKLDKVTKDIEDWNEKFYEKKDDKTSKSDFKSDQKFTEERTNFINYLIDMVNPYFFKDFIERVTVISSTLPDRKNMDKHSEDIKRLKTLFYESEEVESTQNSFKTYYKSENEIESPKKSKDNVEGKKLRDIKKEYDLKFTDYPELFVYILVSNTTTITYFLFFVNHFMYASLESLVFPLSLLGYSLLEYPRPNFTFFRGMLVYTEIVFFIKFTLQLEIWNKVLNIPLEAYEDTWKIGFAKDNKTNSESLFYYVLWDILIMFILIYREYYFLRIGMWEKIETDIESLEDANKRIDSGDINTESVDLKKDPELSGKPQRKPFLERILPKNKAEKPGRDLYLFTFTMQLIILFYLFIFFSKMVGSGQDISQAIRSNQFQGGMVGSIFIMVLLILIDRYLYLRHTSRAIQDAAKEHESQEKEIKKPEEEPVKRPFTTRNQESRNYQKKFSITFNLEPEKSDLFGYSTMGQINMTTTQNFEKNDEKKNDEDRNTLLKIKLILHGTLVILIHGIVFWYLPIIGCNRQETWNDCNEFETNIYLQGFYVLFLIYLIFASQQIRYGLPSFTNVSFPLMRHISSVSSGFFTFYRGIPFLFELRTVMDWTFTKTSLNIYQWFKLEDIHAQLFINQCIQKSLKYKKYGDPIKFLEKCQYGALSLLVMLTIILLPLFIFSTLNPISEPNPVLSASLSIDIKYYNRNYRTYSISRTNAIQDVNETTIKEILKGLSDVGYAYRNQMQDVTFPASTDKLWEVTPPTNASLCRDLEEVSHYKQSDVQQFCTNTTGFDLQVNIQSTFTRNYPLNPTNVQINSPHSMCKNQITVDNAISLKKMICYCSGDSLTLTPKLSQIIKLPSAGENIQGYILQNDSLNKSLKLTLDNCSGRSYWSANLYDNINNFAESTGLQFYVISDQYSAATFNFSIITFYISIVYVAGRLIRLITEGTGMNVVMTDMQNPEHLNTLCSAIYVSRMIWDIKKEEELYYELLDILRSPEITKKLTGKSSIKDKIKQD
jgi:Piezo non-specific cation channel, R-Ras-binding domain